jgi:hypothetical protein
MGQKDKDDKQIKASRINCDYNNAQYISHIFWKLKKLYPDADKKMIVKIVSRYFELTQDDLSHGNTVSLGGLLGDLYLIKIKRKVYINDNGELVNNLPVDQGATNALWKQKPELRGKTFVRHINQHSSGYLFKLKHHSFKVALANKSIYSFKFSRTLKGKLSKNILNKEVNAYEIKNKDE